MSAIQHKTGFVYITNTSIGQEVAVSRKDYTTYTQDGTRYSFDEIHLVQCVKGATITPAIHLVKRVFEGEIVAVEVKSNKEGSGNGDADTVL
jgi:hypothetical protein